MNGIYDALIENIVTCGCFIDRFPRGCIWFLEFLSAIAVTALCGFGVVVLTIGFFLVFEMDQPGLNFAMAFKELMIGKVCHCVRLCISVPRACSTLLKL